MKIIGIVCSLRKRGNTEILVGEALVAAKEAGAEETEMICLAGKTILPCNGCERCLETGECILNDDMQDIYPKLLEADGIIIGTPVYFWGISGLTKIFIDRTYPFVAGHLAHVLPQVRDIVKGNTKTLRDKVGGIIVATARIGGATALRQVSDFFRAHRMIEAGRAIAFAYQRGEVSKNEEALREARGAGRAVVRVLRKYVQK